MRAACWRSGHRGEALAVGDRIIVMDHGVAAQTGTPAELAATVLKAAYLGSTREYTFETALGPIVVVAAGAPRTLQPGEAAGLVLAEDGVAIVPAAQARGSP